MAAPTAFRLDERASSTPGSSTTGRRCSGSARASTRPAAAPAGGDVADVLHGLVRHMAEVERNWFRRSINGEDLSPDLWDDEHPDGDFEIGAEATPSTPTSRVSAGEVELARADRRRPRARRHRHPQGDGEVVDLRWIYVHMIEEYARHNGHADLLRERIDGATGD